MRRVVVTGIGAVTPIGNTIAEYSNGLQQGLSGSAPITHFDASLFKTRFACEVKNLKVEDFIDRKESKRMDRFSHFAMIATAEAIKNSGLDLQQEDPDRAGVIWGSGVGGLQSLENEIIEFARGNGTPRFNPFLIPRMISDIAAGYISIHYGFRGTNYSTVSACASSNHAILNATDQILYGKADLMVTGGSEAAIIPTGVGGFNAMKALSERNDDPKTASRPFDKDRDGFVLGEGGGALILEDYDHAVKRGAHIYAEIIGGGASADAYHITAPHPEGRGALTVMRAALRDAHLAPESIDYINVHGTSTSLGDISEIKAIQSVFGDHAFKLNISSTKSMTGHLLGAAGAIEAIACILAIQHDFIPPTINHFTDDPEFDPRLNLTFNEAQQKRINIALSNTFGFGGHNTSVIFKRV